MKSVVGLQGIAERFMSIYYKSLLHVLDIGVKKKTALAQCNEVLKTIADSHYDILACGPMQHGR